MYKQILNALFCATLLFAGGLYAAPQQDTLAPTTSPVADTSAAPKTENPDPNRLVCKLRRSKKEKFIYDPAQNQKTLDDYLKEGYRVVDCFPASESRFKRIMANIKTALGVAVTIATEVWDFLQKTNKKTEVESSDKSTTK